MEFRNASSNQLFKSIIQINYSNQLFKWIEIT